MCVATSLISTNSLLCILDSPFVHFPTKSTEKEALSFSEKAGANTEEGHRETILQIQLI